jgi:hypothetical protein
LNAGGLLRDTSFRPSKDTGHGILLLLQQPSGQFFSPECRGVFQMPEAGQDRTENKRYEQYKQIRADEEISVYQIDRDKYGSTQYWYRISGALG